MKKIKKTLSVLTLTVIITVLGACANHDEHDQTSSENSAQEEAEDHEHQHDQQNDRHDTENLTAPEQFNEKAGENLLHFNTKNITRLSSDDPIELSILTSQTIWPATHEANQPGTVILAPLENWQLSLASLNLVHHPNDGPLFFTENGEIPEQVMTEINRLQPKGNVAGIQVMVMGAINENELDKLTDFDIEQTPMTEPAAFANEIDKIYAALTNGTPNGVIVGSMDEDAKTYSIPAGSWISHMSEPLLYVTKTDLPEETSAALERRNGKANIYVLGSEEIISENVFNQLQEYGNVTRISGDNAVDLSIEFAQFKDRTTVFGWGISDPGHGLMIASTASPDLAITAAPFSHLGKHAPMIWLEEGEVTEEWYPFLTKIKPMFDLEPTEGPYNHAYLLGTTNLVSYQTQGILDEKLEIISAHGDHHAGH
ncbi:cell wall-binding repeat-containing protein [Alkalihalobacterium alkalinitrilicum]|uniref:cell wall-binding repeat-containing protein n=1 Tax=Alkalihalobacterium alkalinitrilicum TaxID=427920 RepID=UPI0009957946|nr:ArsR family transcriptional regulator [Alkalihalobacterium alkalinitrilicum]